MEPLELGDYSDGAKIEVAENNTKGTVLSLTTYEMGHIGGYDFSWDEAVLLRNKIDEFLLTKCFIKD